YTAGPAIATTAIACRDRPNAVGTRIVVPSHCAMRIPRTRDDVLRILRRERVARAEDLAALAVPCLILADTTPAKRGRITHLGGVPDLPPTTPWPRSPGGEPLTFLGQIDLAELAATPVAGEFPAAGILGWFYDIAGSPQFAMTFTTGPDRTQRDPPRGATVFRVCEVDLVPAWSLPDGGPDCPF